MTKRDQNQDELFVQKPGLETWIQENYQHFPSPLLPFHLLATYPKPCLEWEKSVISFSLQEAAGKMMS